MTLDWWTLVLDSGWSLTLTSVGVLGLWLAGQRNLYGWMVGLGAQLLWVVYAVDSGQYGFLVSAAAYGTVYGRNTARWLRETGRVPERPTPRHRRPSHAARVDPCA